MVTGFLNWNLKMFQQDKNILNRTVETGLISFFGWFTK